MVRKWKSERKAKIRDFHFHDLRHSFASHLVMAGVDITTVKELLGHQTLTMTLRYSHHFPESLRPCISVLDNCYNFATVGDDNTCYGLSESSIIKHGSV